MSRITLDTSGIETLTRNMKRNKQQVLEHIATDFETTAKSYAAVDTGYMRDHIGATVEGDRVNMVSEADYSSFVEFGTSRMAAQPFMTPAIREVERELPNYMRSLTVVGRLSNIVRSVRTWVFGG